jgi:hypothetical protein
MADRNELGADQRLYVERFLRTSAQYLGVPFPESRTSRSVTLCKPSLRPACRITQQLARRRAPLGFSAVQSALRGEALWW